MNGKNLLLCSFSSISQFKNTIEEIKKFYTVRNNKFFIFSNIDIPKDVFITYNILCEGREFPKFPNTISIHRKKDFNVLYTLNSMNQLIMDENNGILDKKFPVDWSLFKDSFVITGKPSVRIIPIELLEIVN
jgi:hypothetical protein